MWADKGQNFLTAHCEYIRIGILFLAIWSYLHTWNSQCFFSPYLYNNNDTLVGNCMLLNFHTLFKHPMNRRQWKWNREVVCIARSHTVKSRSPDSCCALPKINSMCMLKLNTDAMILGQIVMSVAKDTVVAKAFSILTPNTLTGEIERNSVTSAASSLSAVTDIRFWESHE